MSVGIASWGRSLGESGLAGSLFAAAGPERLDAARALHWEGLAVHADLIVRTDTSHRGVTPEQIRAVRNELPDARIDLHLIVDGDAGAAVVRVAVDDAVELAHDLRAERLSVSRELLEAHRARLQTARRKGLAVWCELPHDDEANAVDGTDGRLVMFIRPGTTHAANPAGLNAVRSLAGKVPVGADGGITEDLARACAALGASPIVSGRALLTTIDQKGTP